MKKIILALLLFLPFNMSHAENGWKDRLLQHERDFEVIKVEHTKMYKMISKLFIKRFSMQEYYNLMMEGKDERQAEETSKGNTN